MRRLVRFVCVVMALVLWALADKAAAGGLEFAGAGAQGLGRAGAVAARADDPMVLYYNPAGLAELRGNQLLLNVNFTSMSACVDPIGYYGWGAYGGGSLGQIPASGQNVPLNLGSSPPDANAGAYYTGQFDTVCMSQRILGVPQLAMTARLSERLGIGFGLIFPNATPQGQWGDDNGVIQGAAGPRPAATRYMLMRSGTIGIFPTIGVAYRIADWLRIGARFEWGIINIDNTTMAAVSGGTSPHNDVIGRVEALDLFVPAVNASIHLVPADSLDIVGAIRIQDDVNAPGKAYLTTGVFNPAALPQTTQMNVTSVRQKMPWQLSGSIRYANRLAPRPTGDGNDDLKNGGRIHDAMEDERWDAELDVQYEMNARNQRQIVDYDEMQAILFRRPDGMTTSATFPDSPRTGENTDTVITKNWKNQISVRFGGTYNVLPGLFALSVGAHYETRGVDPSYMQIDYWPVSRVGLHAGVKFRIARSIDIVASYAHIFQETIVVDAPPHAEGTDISKAYAETGNIDSIDRRSGPPPRGGQAPIVNSPVPAQVDGIARSRQIVTKVTNGSPPYIVNAGTYRSGIDVVAIGANVHF